MGKAIFKTNLKREPGKLYYVKSDKEKILWLFEAVMSKGGRPKKKKEAEDKDGV